MSYVPLAVDLSAWGAVNAFVRGPLEALHFHDVHTMLRLPITSIGISAGCNFSIAHALLAAVGGISTTLHCPGSDRYQRAFCKTLVEFYPWDAENPTVKTVAEKRTIAETLWEEFRGPLTHHSGLWTHAPGGGPRRVKDRGYHVKYKRMGASSEEGLPEEVIAELERASSWPFAGFRRTLVVRPDAKVLKLERLYWGVRRMVTNLAARNDLMSQAERFLSQIDP